MKQQVKKLVCGLFVAGVGGSLAGCGVTSEVATHSSAPTVGASQAMLPAEPLAAHVSRPAAPHPATPATVAPPLAEATTTIRAASGTLRPPAAVATAATSNTAPSEAGSPYLRTQSGRIIDEAGQPLVGATVLLKGTTRGASTDAQGNYQFEVPLGTNTFVFGYSGYQDEVAQSRDGQPLTVTLLPTADGTVLAEPSKEPRAHTHRVRH